MKSFKNSVLVIAIFATLMGFSVNAQDNAEMAVKKAAQKSEEITTAAIGKSAPDFTLMGADGKKHSLNDYNGKYVVLEWVNFDCPFVKKHYNSNNMQTLQANYIKQDVVWLSICSSAPGKQGYFEGEELSKRLAAEKSKASTYLIDADGMVGMMYEAKTTPHMFIVDPKGMLLYAGGIDDKASTNQEDIEGATNYVVKALTESMNGKEVSNSVTPPYGCAVKYKN